MELCGTIVKAADGNMDVMTIITVFASIGNI